MQYKRISADCHLDMPCMPPELFVENASRELKAKMPHVVDGPDGPHWVSSNGADYGLVNGVGPGGQKYVPGQNYRVDKMNEAGLYDDAKKGKYRARDPDLRLKDMMDDGVDAEIIFGVLGSTSKLDDKEASNELLRIYNDWLKAVWSKHPERQLPLACLPYGDIDEAVKEIHRVAKMGLINIIAAMMGAGVFDRYPTLRVSFGESGAGWLAYALDRMDFEFEDRFRDLMKLKPSEYWRRNCKCTFQFDRIGAKLIDDIGLETMMWGSDYPHTDGVWPESDKFIQEQFAELTPDQIHKITCENAAKFYRFTN